MQLGLRPMSRRAAVATAVVVIAGVAAIAVGQGRDGLDRLLGSKCKLCEKWSGEQAARICSTCSSQAGSKCVLCRKWSAEGVMRICSTCASRAGSKCVLCQKWSAEQVARICSTCQSR